MINVRGLVKNHGSNRVLDGVDLALNRGEVAAIIGPSGGGKSTLLRCINGLESFQAGRIDVDTIQLHPKAAKADLLALRRRVGMVFQQFNLFANLNVLQNVTIGPRLSLHMSIDEADVLGKKLLDRVGLADKHDSRPDQLSGGQQQRVAIARALAVKPEAVLFDEPTSALDPRMSAEVMAVIADLANDGLTMLIVTHAMGFARKAAHTVHVMHAGRVAESGPPAQIFDAPATDVTRQFIHQANN